MPLCHMWQVECPFNQQIKNISANAINVVQHMMCCDVDDTYYTIAAICIIIS